MNKPKEFKGFKIREGLGFENPHYLKRAIWQVPTPYDHLYFNHAKEYRMRFTKSSDEVEAKADEWRKRKDNVQIPYNYNRLNDSYSSREISLSDDYISSYTVEELKHVKSDDTSVNNCRFYEVQYYKTLKDLDDERKMNSVENDHMLRKIYVLQKQVLSLTRELQNITKSYSNTSDTSSVRASNTS